MFNGKKTIWMVGVLAVIVAAIACIVFYVGFSGFGGHSQQNATNTGHYYLRIVSSQEANFTTPSDGIYEYANGSVVSISAKRCIGPGCELYSFLNWSGNGTGSYSGTDNSTEIVMVGNITETANYQKNQGTSTTTTIPSSIATTT